jgi:hypothetical protein
VLAEATIPSIATNQGWANEPGDFITLSKGKYRAVSVKVFPLPPVPDIPQHLPDEVRRLFSEGAQIRMQSASGACGNFRHALELALKTLSPNIEAWKLEKRIDAMAANHLITPAIKDWAHQIRMLGNEALHDTALPTAEEAAQLEAFTRHVLIYLYTMPKQIELARGEVPPA